MDNYKNKIANYLNSGIDDAAKELLLKLFPELKESEDEKILEIIKHCIESRYLHTSTIKGISQKQCLAWLEKQSEQTPAWSEEDEYLLDETITHLEALIRITKKLGSAYSDEIQYYQRDINWLKSLKDRYTWKPSDEQIYWLKWAANRMPDTEKANEEEVVLKELLEQLKKLK